MVDQKKLKAEALQDWKVASTISLEAFKQMSMNEDGSIPSAPDILARLRLAAEFLKGVARGLCPELADVEGDARANLEMVQDRIAADVNAELNKILGLQKGSDR